MNGRGEEWRAIAEMSVTHRFVVEEGVEWHGVLNPRVVVL